MGIEREIDEQREREDQHRRVADQRCRERQHRAGRQRDQDDEDESLSEAWRARQLDEHVRGKQRRQEGRIPVKRLDHRETGRHPEGEAKGGAARALVGAVEPAVRRGSGLTGHRSATRRAAS